MTTVPNRSAEWPSPAPELRVEEIDPDTAVVAAEGELDLPAAPALKWTVLKAFAAGRRRVVVDLSRVTFIDSTSLGVLLSIKRNLGREQRLVLGGVNAVSRNVLKLAGIEYAFRPYPTSQAALAHLDQFARWHGGR